MADEESALRRLVMSGVGLALMMEKEARDPDVDGKICILRENVGSLDMSLMHLRKRADDPLIAAIVQAVTTVWGVSEARPLDAPAPA